MVTLETEIIVVLWIPWRMGGVPQPLRYSKFFGLGFFARYVPLLIALLRKILQSKQLNSMNAVNQGSCHLRINAIPQRGVHHFT
jgi:hypothetical protein